jgi:hypothetical protein
MAAAAIEVVGQFLGDSYATAASFRKDGPWTVHIKAGAELFAVS